MKRIWRFRRLEKRLRDGAWVLPRPEIVRHRFPAGRTTNVSYPAHVVEQEIWRGEIAFSEDHLHAKLDGAMAEVIDPGGSWWSRLWRMLVPMKMIECSLSSHPDRN